MENLLIVGLWFEFDFNFQAVQGTAGVPIHRFDFIQGVQGTAGVPIQRVEFLLIAGYLLLGDGRVGHA